MYFAGKLSKRSSMWESTYNLSNYTRPQGWAIVDHSKQVKDSEEDLASVINSICLERYSIELDAPSLEDLVKYASKQSSGYALTYNRLVRLIGQWLVTEFKPRQDYYDEGYQSLSF